MARAVMNPEARAEFERLADDPRPVVLDVRTLETPGETANTTCPAVLRFLTVVPFDIEGIGNFHWDRTGTTTFLHELVHVNDALYGTWGELRTGDEPMSAVSTTGGAATIAQQRAVGLLLFGASLVSMDCVSGRVVLASKALVGFATLPK